MQKIKEKKDEKKKRKVKTKTERKIKEWMKKKKNLYIKKVWYNWTYIRKKKNGKSQAMMSLFRA